MSHKRLSDTAALVVATPEMSDDHYSLNVSVRKIDNGYVKCVSECSGGDYKSTETFSRAKPDLVPSRAAPTPNSLRDAMRSMK